MSTTLEQRELRMHHRLLYDVIFRQAGTREKGVLEGVMNSIDAGATNIEVTIDETALRIQDDGRGFPTREEIVANFECFGTPHEEGDATYGRFRMGRGQLFAFGYNTWRSRTFEMKVDAREALTYNLTTNLPDQPGCDISVVWYDPFYPSELDGVVRQLARWLRFVEVPVWINGTQINLLPQKEKWDIVTEDAYIRFKERGSVEVYNLGVFVRDYPSHLYGTGGLVVSRKRLDVNFARNDVQSTCPIWKAVQKLLKGDLKKRATKRVNRSLPDDEVQFWLESIKHAEVEDSEQVRKLRLFRDVTGRHWAHDEIVAHMRRHGITRITLAPLGDPAGDRLHTGQQVFVLAQDALDAMDVRSLNDFLLRLQAIGLTLPAIQVPLAEAARSLGLFQEVPKTKWTPRERAIVRNIQSSRYGFARILGELYGYDEEHQRDIRIGMARDARAWTDGQTFIALERGWLKRLLLNEGGWIEVAFTLLHEYLHTDSNTETHNHSPSFYREYHDHRDLAISLGVQLLQNWHGTLVAEGLGATRTATKILDRHMRRLHAEAVADDCSEVLQRVETLKQELQDCAQRLRRTKR